MAHLCALRKRTDAFGRLSVLGLHDLYVAKGGVPAEFFYPRAIRCRLAWCLARFYPLAAGPKLARQLCRCAASPQSPAFPPRPPSSTPRPRPLRPVTRIPFDFAAQCRPLSVPPTPRRSSSLQSCLRPFVRSMPNAVHQAMVSLAL